MSPGKLLERIAATLRRDIGPAVGAAYPRTQAFMAAVVLQKLGRQLALAEAHGAADAAEMKALIADLDRSSSGVPAPVGAAVAALRNQRDDARLCALIEALYAHRAVLGNERFDALLSRVRRTLRANIDRRMEFAE